MDEVQYDEPMVKGRSVFSVDSAHRRKRFLRVVGVSLSMLLAITQGMSIAFASGPVTKNTRGDTGSGVTGGIGPNAVDPGGGGCSSTVTGQWRQNTCDTIMLVHGIIGTGVQQRALLESPVTPAPCGEPL